MFSFLKFSKTWCPNFFYTSVSSKHVFWAHIEYSYTKTSNFIYYPVSQVFSLFHSKNDWNLTGLYGSGFHKINTTRPIVWRWAVFFAVLAEHRETRLVDTDWKDQKVESRSSAVVVELAELVEPNEWLNTGKKKKNYTPLFDPFLYTVILALGKVCRAFITRDDIRYNRITLSCDIASI